jgi:hypothetical protein
MTWIPTGPTSVRSGLSWDDVAVAGRTKDLAVSADGARVYLATSTGGVWRSDDGGVHWLPLTDGLDGHPATTHTCSLSCGAVAIDPTNADRVFVGSGEPSGFGGIGVLRSDNAGLDWTIESADAASPSLMGQSCYAIMIDPNMLERVVGVFTGGVYRREPAAPSGFHWVRFDDGGGFVYTDGVVTNAGGVTTFYVARTAYVPDATHLPAVVRSNDGAAWLPTGTGFPASGVGSFVLGVQPNDANLVYALVPDPTATSGSLLRLDLPDPQWRTVSGLPALFYGQPPRCCAVDPNHANTLFLASIGIVRCAVTSTGSGPSLAYAMTSADVNFLSHNDYHRLRYVGLDSDKLWAGNDGGAFYTANASTLTTWQSRSAGLGTIQPNAMDVHPTQDAVAFIATQDNGTIRAAGDDGVWFGLTNMDGSWVIVNWADPYKVLTGTSAYIAWRATDGAAGFSSWDTSTSLPAGSVDSFVPFAATTPYDPSTPASADIVAVAGNAVWLTRNFGTLWTSIPNGDPTDALAGDTFRSLAFAGPNRIFALSTGGVARRYDFDGTNWHVTNLAPPAGVSSFAAIAVDYADATRQSFYIALYGSSTFQRVWHYDGAAWTARSGPAEGDPAAIPTALFNALVTDPNHPLDVYAGCDVGVWRSTNGGSTWSALNDGLPQAPVTDLKIHHTFPTLYAAVYGRGVFEYDLTGAVTPAARLYIRDTLWDTGKRATVDGLTAPADRTRLLYHWDGPDIVADAPAADGSYQFAAPGITPYQFITALVDESGAVETAGPSAPVLVNRVYVRVHNRGLTPVTDATLTLLLAPAAAGLPDLPAGFTNTVQTGAALASSPWRLVGTRALPPVAAGAPVVVQLDLPSTMLPPPAMLPGNSHYCLLAMVHSPSLDAFVSTEQHVDTLTVHDRKATNKNLNVVPMAVAPAGPAPPHLISPWVPVGLNGSSQRLGALRLDARATNGFVDVVMPNELLRHHPKSRHVVQRPDVLAAWKEAAARSHAWLSEHAARRYDPHDTKQTLEHLQRAAHGATALRIPGTRVATLLETLPLAHGEQHAFYMRFTLPLHAGAAAHRVHVFHDGKPLGGITYELRPPSARHDREANTKPGFHRGEHPNAKFL